MLQSASAAAPSSSRPNRRKWTREQLVRNLQILGSLSAPLPPDLPPSPPPSRSSSPALGNKRKHDATDPDHSKRPRTLPAPELPQHRPHLPPAPPPQHLRVSNPLPFNPRSEPAEDGEVREEIAVASSSRGPTTDIVSSAVPIRRPKRGRGSSRHFDMIHDFYHNAGRKLKYSGDARFWSTYPSTHKEYRPLADPPPVNSPYHKYGGLIARLELVDALVCFTYSIWSKDYSRRSCFKDTWGTIEAFLIWCKQKWQAEEGINDAEKAFLGLIWMIEAFINARKMAYAVKTHLDNDMDKVLNQSKTLMAAAATAVLEENPMTGPNGEPLMSRSQPTPPMLPSPASIAPTNSANSTPASRVDGTPNSAARGQPPAPVTRLQSVSSMVTQLLTHPTVGPPIPQPVVAAMSSVTVPIGPFLIQDLKDLTAGYSSSGFCMNTSQTTLNLPIMARLFPNTFARMMYTTLSANEEHEPDFEDEYGELFWPGQCITGEGIGWVCLMGKAMIKEFGKAYGYKGLDGVVPKPKPEETAEEAAAGTTGSSEQGQNTAPAHR